MHYFLVFMFKFFFSINGLVLCASLCRWCLKTAVEQFRWKELFSLWFVVEWAGRGGNGNRGSYVYYIFDRFMWYFTLEVLNHFPHNLKRVKVLNARLGKKYEKILSGQYLLYWTCFLRDLNVLNLSSTCVGTPSRPVQSGNSTWIILTDMLRNCMNWNLLWKRVYTVLISLICCWSSMKCIITF